MKFPNFLDRYDMHRQSEIHMLDVNLRTGTHIRRRGATLGALAEKFRLEAGDSMRRLLHVRLSLSSMALTETAAARAAGACCRHSPLSLSAFAITHLTPCVHALTKQLVCRLRLSTRSHQTTGPLSGR